MRRPSFTKLGEDIERSSLLCKLISEFGYLTASNAVGSTLSDVENKTTPNCALFDRAEFSLSRALFRKNAGPLTWAADRIFLGKTDDLFSVITLSCQFCSVGVAPFIYYFLLKNWRPSFAHHCRSYSFHSFTRVSPIISGL